MSDTIGIMGCGWLGLPLAKSFVGQGFQVRGSTTSQEKCRALKKLGINGFVITLSQKGIEGPISTFLEGLDILVVNIPPRLKGKGAKNYERTMQLLFRSVRASTVEKIIFVSSTSVYGDAVGEVTETTPPRPATESGRQLCEAEAIFRNASQWQTTIVRFGGLLGPDRHPVNNLSGRKGLTNGNDFINLVHQEDCIRILEHIVNGGWWNEIFNGVYPFHPTKKEYYTSEALKRGVQPPEYKSNNHTESKKVRPFALVNVKNFRFKTSIVS